MSSDCQFEGCDQEAALCKGHIEQDVKEAHKRGQREGKSGEHTPGPWIHDKENHWISSNNSPVPWNDANARLIASAPRLLAERDALLGALQHIIDNGDHHFTDNNGWTPTLTVNMYERARAAIRRCREGD